jgi:prepilin-type N-terminal cleavage/methylation domain-containing protein
MMRQRSLNQPTPRQRRGFTLVELAVALTLISVALLGTAGLMTTSMRYQRGASTRDDMVTLTEMKLDELRANQLAPKGSAGWNSLAVGGSLTSSASGYSDDVTVNSKIYRRRWEIAPSAGGTREVTIRIEPTFGDASATRRVEMGTLVFVQ